MLKVCPLARYAAPRYPTARCALQNPRLLRRLPARFAAKPAACAVLSAVLGLGLAGCAVPQEVGPQAPNTALPPAQPAQQQEQKPMQLAVPLFEHGVGMGSYGCVSVAPPVFLSEEEAAQVISDEAAKYGLGFSAGHTLEKARLPLHRTFLEQEEQGKPLKTTKGELELDGYDQQLQLGFEFVSLADLQQWQDPGQRVATSVESWYFKAAAAALAAENANVAVFYDPASSNYSEFNYVWPEEDDGGAGYRAYIEEYSATQREKSIEDLRAQVRDFLDWLKAQGVI